MCALKTWLGTRRPDEQDDAVQRQDAAVDLAPQGEVKDRLRHETALDVLGEND